MKELAVKPVRSRAVGFRATVGRTPVPLNDVARAIWGEGEVWNPFCEVAVNATVGNEWFGSPNRNWPRSVDVVESVTYGNVVMSLLSKPPV